MEFFVSRRKSTVDYVKVEFLPGDHGSIETGSVSTYWVKKGATWGQLTDVVAPMIVDDLGYTFDGWTLPDSTTMMDADRTFTATYTAKAQIVTEDPNDPDYVSITYHSADATDQATAHGKIKKGDAGDLVDTVTY